MQKWIEPDIRNDVVGVVERLFELTRQPLRTLIEWVGIRPERFYDWKKRREQPNRHNAPVPKQGWLLDWEKQKIIAFFHQHPQLGYRRLAWMMVDADVVAVSPTSVWRVLNQAGLLKRFSNSDSKKGQGFNQPRKPHEHWHSDVSYLNIAGTFYYFFGLIDGASRYIVHWEIRESMTESDLEIVIERAREKFPQARPRIISDNGPPYVSHDFREFIRISGMTHVRTSPYYPQSNGKIERFHGTLKQECVRPKTPVDLEDARRVVGSYVDHYNNERLHSAIGYVAPLAVLEGRADQIQAARQQKLAAARSQRTQDRANSSLTSKGKVSILDVTGETETGSAGEQPDQGIAGGNFDTKSPAQEEDIVPFLRLLTHRREACPMPEKTHPKSD